MSDIYEKIKNSSWGKGLSEDMMNRLGVYTFSYFVQERVVLCSDSLVKRYGVLPEYDGNVKKFVEDLLAEDNIAYAMDFIYKVKEGSDQRAMFLSRIGGNVLHISLFVSQKLDNGQADVVEGIVENVTDKILSDNERKNVINTDLKMLSTAIKTIYPLGIMLNLSKNSYRMVSFDINEVLPSPLTGMIDDLMERGISYIPDEEGKQLFKERFSRQALLQAYIAGKREVSLEHRQTGFDGIVHWAESRTLLFEGENMDICAICLNSHIDEKKKQEEEMREQLEIVDALSKDFLNVYIIDLERDRLKINKSIGGFSYDLFDYNREADEFEYTASAEKFIKILVHPDEVEDVLQQVSIDFMRRILEHSDEYVSSCRVINRAGAIHHFQYKFVKPRHDDNNTVIMAFQNIDSIVAREAKMNAELQKSIDEAKAANEAKSTFFFNMSHDIRTPMNAILGFANLLKQNEDDVAVRHKYIDNICVSGKYLLELINGVLEMSRIESGNFSFDEQCMNIDDLFESVGSMFSEEYKKKKLTVERYKDYEHKYVYADFTKCQEVAVNIVSNAVKYTPEGGTIKVYSNEIPHAYDGYAYYETIIEDTGIGISAEYLPHIFDRFSRERTYTDNKIVGTGLGMGITKKIVEAMGGTISVESQLGKGTKVTYTVPFKIADAAEIAKDKLDLSQTFTGETKRILLAEDNELNSDIAIALLESRGFEVELARDGSECIELVKKMEEDYYDLILMDIQMPGLNGYQTAIMIRSLPELKKASIPIIAMTANVFDEDRKRAFEAGMNGFAGKPIEVQQLFGEIGRVLTI